MTDRENLLQSMAAADVTNPFVTAFIQLCEISYQTTINNIPILVNGLQTPYLGNGIWRCVWGPAYNTPMANLVYVATYALAAGQPPVFAAVVIRGTDIDTTTIIGEIEQIWEDLDVLGQSPLPWASGNAARVANGTLDGLAEIQALVPAAGQKGAGQTLQSFLTAFMADPANSNPVLVVTGHSLGGCLTTVTAPWLTTVLPNSTAIVPFTYAAPTAGNAAFASYYNATFSYSIRCYNTLDVIPLAWASLPDMEIIYLNWDLFPTLAEAAAILGFDVLMYEAGVTYDQPVSNFPVPGTFQQVIPPLAWTDQALYQHHATTYVSLLGGTPTTQAPLARAAAELPRVRRERKRPPSIAAAMAKVKGT